MTAPILRHRRFCHRVDAFRRRLDASEAAPASALKALAWYAETQALADLLEGSLQRTGRPLLRDLRRAIDRCALDIAFRQKAMR